LVNSTLLAAERIKDATGTVVGMVKTPRTKPVSAKDASMPANSGTVGFR
jgi:hypothetical protein